MIDIEFLKNNFEAIKKKMENRNGVDLNLLNQLINLDRNRKMIITELEKYRAENNQNAKLIGRSYKGEKLGDIEALKAKKVINDDKIKHLNKELEKVTKEFNDIWLLIPNIADDSVPIGKSENDNQVIRQFGKIIKQTKPHWDIALEFDLIDLERAVRMSGARFALYKGDGAKLIRALISFMLDHHSTNGYLEINPPVIVNKQSLINSGNLPKFGNDLFKINDKQYLIPTAEAVLTNLFTNEIMENKDLPSKFCAYTLCFRQEAGAAGRDTRGLIRMHQFNKIELYIFSKQTDSFVLLEKLTKDAESILQLLNLPYQTIALCTGDLGFSSAKTYDIEVWMPSQNSYREISSCSNCTDFQARRAKIRYKEAENEKTKLVHTLNGSGVAVDRLFAAILENNYDESEKIIKIPQVLVKYMNGQEKIVKK